MPAKGRCHRQRHTVECAAGPAYTKRVPLGVVGIITPWNFPVAIPIWKIAPALICGNTVVWKPAEVASLTATRLAELFAEAGSPGGVLNLLVGKVEWSATRCLSKWSWTAELHRIDCDRPAVAAACAKRNIKYQTEMGGKNAAIADARWRPSDHGPRASQRRIPFRRPEVHRDQPHFC